ncbi:hypothetical protein B0H21DRAFT_821479 [Amylocystis lapponica]|nr:hypothetical protein B0H21DRAFT_821479 [Amylocystis lapponica]
MPATRSARRSRRLSRQSPGGSDPEFDDVDLDGLQLIKPEDGPLLLPSSPPASPAQSPPPSPDTPPDSSFTSRSAHTRRKKPGHIPRPPNAFIIFRSALWDENKHTTGIERDHREISRMAGSIWNKLSDAERAPYKARAEAEKQKHAIMYPEYKYTPVYRKDKPAKRKPKEDDATGTRRKAAPRLVLKGPRSEQIKQSDEDSDFEIPARPSPRRARPPPRPPVSRPAAPVPRATRPPPRPRPAPSSKPKEKGKGRAAVAVKVEEQLESMPSAFPPDDADLMDEESDTASSDLESPFSKSEIHETPEFVFSDREIKASCVAFTDVPIRGPSDPSPPPMHLQWPTVSSYGPGLGDTIFTGLNSAAIRTLMQEELRKSASGSSQLASFSALASDFAGMSVNSSPALSPEDVFEPTLFLEAEPFKPGAGLGNWKQWFET